jgi:1-acyl-sn-glycerol-3-phosphate acyltransferase
MTAILKHLNRAYRFVGQSLFWILFGLFGIAVGFLVLPLVLVFVRDPERRQVAARNTISACFGLFVWVACRMRLITCRVTGMEHHDAQRAQLILANHPTLIDVVILISLFPQVDCVIKEAVTKNPVMRTSVGTANYISNREPSDLLESCAGRLRSGASLLLFPEGTRSVAGQALNFKPGAAEVAIRADAEILPVVVDCRPQFLAKHEPWYYIPPRAPHFDIRILAPLKPGDLVPPEAGDRHARQILNRSLQELFEAELA